MADTFLTRAHLQNFTVFQDMEVEFSPGLNLVLGVNGTGKTHLLKVLYAAAEASRDGCEFSNKIGKLFLADDARSFLMLERYGAGMMSINVDRSSCSRLSQTVANFMHADPSESAWRTSPMTATYLHAREILSIAPGFLSLNSLREIHFDSSYADLLGHLYLPALRNLPDWTKPLLERLEDAIGGTVTIRGEHFFITYRDGRDLEVNLVAEGVRKLANLWVLIRNGYLRSGALLFWDEPESNLNPALARLVVEILLELTRHGMQIFVATHSFNILKEVDLQVREDDKVRFITLAKDGENGVKAHMADHYLDIEPDAISDVFADLYDRDLDRAIKRTGRGK